MTYQRINPIDPREAFTVSPTPETVAGNEVAASQAALLLILRAGVLGVTPAAKESMMRDVNGEFPTPALEGLRRARRMSVAEATGYLDVSASELQQQEGPNLQERMARIVKTLYEKPSIEVAASLFEAAMYSPHPLVAAAAAAGASETTRLRGVIRDTLTASAQSVDPLTARVAQTALSKIEPENPEIQKRVVSRPESSGRDRKSETAVVTHGTFAADNGWYQPDGDFYVALDTNRPDWHLHDQSFRWTGAWSDSARQADAVLLNQWLVDQGLATADFLAHSHGGTVAHLATHHGTRFNRLVLMSWPARERDFPDFANVNRIVDIRVRMDLVILVDGGGQRFSTNQFNIQEHRHGWFNHSATHYPDYWDDHDLWTKITV